MPSPRLNDRETEQRILDAAVALVEEQGIDATLEGVAFDEVVRRAGVSRTSAYRRWPSRDKLAGDVLLRIASGTTLPAPDARIGAPAAATVAAHRAALDTPEGRHGLLVELLRVSIGNDYSIAAASPEWRTFLSLLGGHRRIADPDVRERVAAELVATQRRALLTRARVYGQFTALLGYRLVAPLAGPDGFELMSRAAGAMMTGLLATVDATGPDDHTPRRLRAFGASEPAEWTPEVYVMAAAILPYIEPDPGITWDAQRIDDLLVVIADITSPD